MENGAKRVVVTGMGINTALGDDLDVFYANLLAGRSGITKWKFLDTSRVHSKVGGDLSGYDTPAKLVALAGKLPEDVHKRVRRLAKKAPFSTRSSTRARASWPKWSVGE